MRNVIYQFQSSNGQDKPVRQYGRQTGIKKMWPLFGKKKYYEFFFVHLLLYMQEELWFYLFWFSHSYSSKLQRNLKEKYKRRNNSRRKQFFKNLRKPILEDHKRNHIRKFLSSRLNGLDVIERTHIHTYIHTAKHR